MMRRRQRRGRTMVPSWWRTAAVMSCLTLFTSSQTILTTLSKRNGIYEYNYATVPFLAETLKMLLCAVFILFSVQTYGRSSVRITLRASDVLVRYPVPSLVYLVLNNVHFAVLFYLDPATFQILSNLKIVTTAILFRLFLRRRLTQVQWLALLLLTVGTTVAEVQFSWGRPDEGSAAGGVGKGVLRSPWQGVALAVAGAWLSAGAGVYTEFLMKQDDDSILWQNLQLYMCGVLCNGANVILSSPAAAAGSSSSLLWWWQRMAAGYNAHTWMVVANMALTGLTISWIMKYADVIVKVYATSMGMLVTTLLSVAWTNFQPAPQVWAGIVISSASLYLYFRPPSQLPR